MASLPSIHSKYGPIVDKDKFQKELQEAIQKALQSSETPAKEKHIRSAIIATWREQGCATLWKIVLNFPLQRSNTVCWKACYLLHKMLRDGYPENPKKSAGSAKHISELAKHWNHLGDGYSRMITAYLKLVWVKIATHVKNPEIPSNLNFQEKPYPIPSDIDYVFQLAVEVFDYQSAILHLYAAVLANIDPSRGVSASQIQCRIAPFVPAIQESAALYDLEYKIMKALHTSLPADTLSGHRERFNRQYHALRKYFAEASKMDYIKKLVDVPTLPPEPPSFLRGSFLADLELSQQVVTHTQSDEASLRTDTLLDLAASPSASLPASTTSVTGGIDEVDRFDAVFGSVTQESFTPAADGDSFPYTTSLPSVPRSDEKDLLIEQLMREIVELKERIQDLEGQVQADYELIGSLRQQMEQKTRELEDYKEVAEHATSENELLKNQLESCQSGQGAQTEAIEARAKASEQKFVQLKEVYAKLRNEHISLLRNSAETQKKLATAEHNMQEGDKKRLELEREVNSLGLQMDEINMQTTEESVQLSMLRETMKHKEMESIKLEQSQALLKEQLVKAEETGSHSIVVNAVEQAETIIRQMLEQMDSPSTEGLTCSPTYLSKRSQSALETVTKVVTQFSVYSGKPSAMGDAVATLLPLSQSVSEVMLQGIAAGHTASADTSLKMTQSCKAIGDNALQLLATLKTEKLKPSVMTASANALQQSIRSLSNEAEALRLQAPSPDEGVGDLVEEEMASTAIAIDEAAKKIEEMLKRSREEQTGVNLEVNGRILDSCTDLMKAIQVLIKRSKELQKEIAAEGMGSMVQAGDFYKKNSRWSEGLISAAKQVGWGASLLVDAADKVVSGEGKFEQLIVTSKDIAASTAQLVAASKVKARSRSEKLKALKGSSRIVSEATGSVVASAQSGAEIKAEAASKPDYTKLTLNQAKRLEMESQVRALELEKELEMERTRLAELRKIHYHLGGAGEGWDEES